MYHERVNEPDYKISVGVSIGIQGKEWAVTPAEEDGTILGKIKNNLKRRRVRIMTFEIRRLLCVLVMTKEAMNPCSFVRMFLAIQGPRSYGK